MASFAYKPAALRGEHVFELEGSLLSLPDGRQLDLRKVSKAVFVNHRLGDATLRRFDLRQDGEVHSISVTVPTRSAELDRDAATHIDLLSAISEALAEAQPGFHVAIGEYGWSRKALFALGALATLGSGGLFVAAIVSGIAASRLAGAAVPFGLLFVMGLWLLKAFRPGQALPTVKAATFPSLLKKLEQTSGSSN